MSDIDKNAKEQLSSLSRVVKALDHTGRELIAVMDKQIKAIIASDTKAIGQLSEAYTSLKGKFEKQERVFIDGLGDILLSEERKEEPVKLDHLKSLYPGSTLTVDRWKQLLNENAAQLKRKHDQLTQLLEFALERNAEMMQTIYRLSSEKTTHYNFRGDKNGVVSGIAINQEV